jgi:hypothetical protein
MSDIAPIGEHTPAAAKPQLCSCTCLVNWVAPLLAPDVDDPGMPVSTVAAGPPIVETETTTGTTYWTAKVNIKTYVCKTPKVIKTVADTPNLAHNKYTITRKRTLGPIVITVLGFTLASIGPYLLPGGIVIGTWGPWSLPATVAGGAFPAAQALASAVPPLTPDCTTVGVACP